MNNKKESGNNGISCHEPSFGQDYTATFLSSDKAFLRTNRVILQFISPSLCSPEIKEKGISKIARINDNVRKWADILSPLYNTKVLNEALTSLSNLSRFVAGFKNTGAFDMYLYSGGSTSDYIV